MTVGELIKKYREENNLSQRQFAAMCGLSNGYISMLEKNENPRTKLPVNPTIPALKAIAKTMQLTLDDLLNLSDDMDIDLSVTKKNVPAPGIMPLPKTVKKPRLGTIACGKPVLAVEEAEQWDAVPEGIDCDFTLECKGDSMINARIFPGDIVYIKAQPIVENGEIAAVLIGEETTLKKVYYNNSSDRIVLQPCNPLYSDMVYSGSELDEIKILGKAVAFLSKVRV